MSFRIEPVTSDLKDWVLEVIRGWGADFIVSRGRKLYPSELDGFYAVDNQGKRLGLATYEIVAGECELVTIDALTKFSGIGTALLERVGETAKQAGCSRLWLITTNDNLDAVRFYQKRGLTIAAIHVNALEQSRKIKPAIPLIGQYGIPLRDEIEFELMLN